MGISRGLYGAHVSPTTLGARWPVCSHEQAHRVNRVRLHLSSTPKPLDKRRVSDHGHTERSMRHPRTLQECLDLRENDLRERLVHGYIVLALRLQVKPDLGLRWLSTDLVAELILLLTAVSMWARLHLSSAAAARARRVGQGNVIGSTATQSGGSSKGQRRPVKIGRAHV